MNSEAVDIQVVSQGDEVFELRCRKCDELLQTVSERRLLYWVIAAQKNHVCQESSTEPA